MVLQTFQATKLKQGSADGCKETGIFVFVTNMLRGNCGIGYIWKELKMLWSMHTYVFPPYCYFTVIQGLAFVQDTYVGNISCSLATETSI